MVALNDQVALIYSLVQKTGSTGGPAPRAAI
jgi:hypothetical protein